MWRNHLRSATKNNSSTRFFYTSFNLVTILSRIVSYQCDQNIMLSFSLKIIPLSSLSSLTSVIAPLHSFPKAHHALLIAAKPLKSVPLSVSFVIMVQ